MEVIRTILSCNKQKFIALVTCFMVVCFTTAWNPALQEQLPEYQVKAVFLYNFSQFVQWPDDAFSPEDSVFVIGVLGDDPFEPYLQEALQGESFNDRPFIIRRYDSPEEVQNCHILYMNESDKGDLEKAIDELQGNHTLTVADISGFCKMGGMIQFERRGSKVRFKINQEAARNAQLQISAKLLRLAEIVSTENTNRP